MGRRTYSLDAAPSEDWSSEIREGTIKFSTNDEELYELAIKQILTIIDALNWRNMLMERRRKR